MADVLGAVFRRFASVRGNALFPPGLEGNTLVLGDRNISRCVLFLAAVTAATDLGLRVMLLTLTPFEGLPVSLRESVAGLRLEALKNVKFVYGQTLEEFLEDVASLHELSSPPSLIIVEDLQRYLHGPRTAAAPQDELSSAAHAAALLHDTAAFLTRKLHSRENQSPCRLIVSFPSERDADAQAADLTLSVLQRYLQVRCDVEEVPGGAEAEQRAWRVYLSATPPVSDPQRGRWQQWSLVMQSSGAVEFHPVTDGETDSRTCGDKE